MTQYIDKSAVVAEIEKRLKEYRTFPDYQIDSNYMELCEILSFLNTLEVKEVDEEYNGKAMLHVLTKGVEQGKREIFDKACEFFTPYIPDNSGGYDRALVIEQFKKAMEE